MSVITIVTDKMEIDFEKVKKTEKKTENRVHMVYKYYTFLSKQIYSKEVYLLVEG